MFLNFLNSKNFFWPFSFIWYWLDTSMEMAFCLTANYFKRVFYWFIPQLKRIWIEKTKLCFLNFLDSKNFFWHLLLIWCWCDISIKVAFFWSKCKSEEWFNSFFRISNGYVVRKINCVFWIFWIQKIFSDISYWYDAGVIYRSKWLFVWSKTISEECFNCFFRNSNGYVIRKLNCVFWVFWIQKIFSDISYLYDTDWIYRCKQLSVWLQTNSKEWFNSFFRNWNGYVVRKLNCFFFWIFWIKKIFSDISDLYDTDWIYQCK